MDIGAISSFSTPAPAEVVARAGSGASAPEPRVRVPQGRENVPPPGLVGSNTMIEFERHEGTGARVVKLVDRRTGEVIDQLPAEQVLDAVANLMRRVMKQEA